MRIKLNFQVPKYRQFDTQVQRSHVARSR